MLFTQHQGPGLAAILQRVLLREVIIVKPDKTYVVCPNIEQHELLYEHVFCETILHLKNRLNKVQYVNSKLKVDRASNYSVLVITLSLSDDRGCQIGLLLIRTEYIDIVDGIILNEL
jgi:hypothetical protein